MPISYDAVVSTLFESYQPMKLLSLFAGAGGLDIGLEQAGFTTVLANELEEHRCKTLIENRNLFKLTAEKFDSWFQTQLEQKCYRSISEQEKVELYNRLKYALRQKRHFLEEAHILQGDVRNSTSEKLAELAKVQVGELGLVAGGPPCQPFSRSGKRQTFTVADGQLFLEFVRVVRDLRPAGFCLKMSKVCCLVKQLWSSKCAGFAAKLICRRFRREKEFCRVRTYRYLAAVER